MLIMSCPGLATNYSVYAELHSQIHAQIHVRIYGSNVASLVLVARTPIHYSKSSETYPVKNKPYW